MHKANSVPGGRSSVYRQLQHTQPNSTVLSLCVFPYVLVSAFDFIYTVYEDPGALRAAERSCGC